jgi:hypothetical protein
VVDKVTARSTAAVKRAVVAARSGASVPGRIGGVLPIYRLRVAFGGAGAALLSLRALIGAAGRCNSGAVGRGGLGCRPARPHRSANVRVICSMALNGLGWLARQALVARSHDAVDVKEAEMATNRLELAATGTSIERRPVVHRRVPEVWNQPVVPHAAFRRRFRRVANRTECVYGNRDDAERTNLAVRLGYRCRDGVRVDIQTNKSYLGHATNSFENYSLGRLDGDGKPKCL